MAVHLDDGNKAKKFSKSKYQESQESQTRRFSRSDNGKALSPSLDLGRVRVCGQELRQDVRALWDWGENKKRSEIRTHET
jgi:hypothetical protein